MINSLFFQRHHQSFGLAPITPTFDVQYYNLFLLNNTKFHSFTRLCKCRMCSFMWSSCHVRNTSLLPVPIRTFITWACSLHTAPTVSTLHALYVTGNRLALGLVWRQTIHDVRRGSIKLQKRNNLTVFTSPRWPQRVVRVMKSPCPVSKGVCSVVLLQIE